MFYSPIKLVFGGIAAWLTVWLLTPVDVIGVVSGSALLYAIACYGGLIIGAVMGGDLALKRSQHIVFPANPWNQPLNLGLFFGSAALGMAGIALRVVDRAYLRGVEYGMNAAELRDALSNSATTWAGMVSGVLFPLCLIPLMLVLASRERSKILLALAAVIFVMPLVESLFQLSRSTLILTLGLGFATVVVARYDGKPFRRRLIAIALVGMLALLAVSTIIFSARIEAANARLTDSVFDSVYATYLRPNQVAQEMISTGSDGVAFATLAVLPNGMYYISGAYEFGALWMRPDGQDFAYGQMLLYPFIRVVQRILGIEGLSAAQVDNYVYRDGVFQTFFGPLWVDFGWIAPFLMVPFGYLVARMARTVRAGSVGLLPIYLYLSIVIFFMPVVNFLVSGLGMFSVSAFAAFAAVAGIAPKGASAPVASAHPDPGAELR